MRSSGADASSDAGSGSSASTVTDADTDAGTGTDTDTVTVTDADTDTVTVTDADTGTVTVTVLNAEVGPGVRLRMKLPKGARELAPGSLPALDVSALPGASVELQRGFGAPMDAGESRAEGAILVVAGCLRGPSDKWAPGVEELLFDRATALARRAIGADLERLEVGAIRAEGKVIQQRLHSTGLRKGEPARVEARHLLGFAGDARDGVLCSVGCAEPLAPGQKEGAVCADIMGSTSLEGALMDAPPPSLLIRLILASAERPLHAGLVAAALGLALVALVLARRPRPRPL